jgi:hypothetical protein
MQSTHQNIERHDTLPRSEPPAALKARKLAEIRAELELIANEINPDLRALRQGIVDGRLFELQELGVFTWQEANDFVQEMQLALGFEVSAASELDVTQVRVTIDWARANEPNTPRGQASAIKITPEIIAVKFMGDHVGYGSSWAGFIEIKRTVAIQTIYGQYENIPDAKTEGTHESVRYTVVGCFSDDTYKSFTGTWTEGAMSEDVYEFNVDLH